MIDRPRSRNRMTVGGENGTSWRLVVGISVLVVATGCYSGLADFDGKDSGISGWDEDDEGGGDDAAEPGERMVPGPAVLPRLTATQYRNSLVDLLGAPLPELPVEPDTVPYLFESIGATSTTLSELGVQRYEESAHAVTRAVFDDPLRREALVGCDPQLANEACVRAFLAGFGRRAFRRPLDGDELAAWAEVAMEAVPGDPTESLRTAVAGMLQAPSFLYRVELGEPDPQAPGLRRLTGWELASRLSFLLWETVPDDALLDAAARGDLDDPRGIELQARRMLEDPRAERALQRFFAQYFDLARLDTVQRDPELFPSFSAELAAAMRVEVERLVTRVALGDADLRQIYGTRSTEVNDLLAAHYGVEAPGATRTDFVPVQLPADGPRAGLLTLGAFLTMNAHERNTSPTLRGKFLRERVLCQSVPPPPDDVEIDVDGDEEDEARTMRERLEQHATDPACVGCHSFIDPPGFLFEHFDAVGAFRELEAGLPVDASGELDGEPLDGAIELSELLVTHDSVPACVVRQLYRHASGRLELPTERLALDELELEFADADYRFVELVVALTVSEAFRTVAEEDDQ